MSYVSHLVPLFIVLILISISIKLIHLIGDKYPPVMNSHPSGIRGFLTVVIGSHAFWGALFGIFFVTNNILENNNPLLLIVSTILLVVNLFIGYNLLVKRTPYTIQLIKRIYICIIISLSLVHIVCIITEQPLNFVSIIGSYTIYLSYIYKSKRIKNTYGSF